VKGKNYQFTMQDTQDITHEVFMDLIKGISSFQKKSILKTYIHSLTLNRVRQHFRKNLTIKRGGSVEKISLEDVDIDLADHRTVRPDSAIMRKQEIRNLRGKMMELPVNLRKVIQLRYEKNFKYKEIADEMDIPEGSVGALIQKALLKLRELIGQESR
jgi:RNA polymerase sigma-70 factor (ECF subfamily)